ncbi:MAG: hypothetical protein CFE45_21935 [Burkholderiales bacterium PBB5]|nr:MAG: hypothetical protein CFE45_21935 [Burkholderiales bacterium PBB5]
MHPSPSRLTTLTALGALAVAAALGLSGCAAMQQLTADVTSYGDWPSGQKPGTYAFDRLPSQAARGEQQQQLEDAARDALARAGFQPAPAGTAPDALVQLGARVSYAERSPWDDPLWWHGGVGYWRGGPWRGPGWGLGARWGWPDRNPRYEREVAVLVRDRSSGKPLYEAHASTEGLSSNAQPLLAPLFAAALAEFPATRAEAHAVTVPLKTP